jgi:hypothetical protein
MAKVRNVGVALGGTVPNSQKEESKKLKAGGKVAPVAEEIRYPSS